MKFVAGCVIVLASSCATAPQNGKRGKVTWRTSKPQRFDRLTPQNGATALLGCANLERGSYGQLRLIVDSSFSMPISPPIPSTRCCSTTMPQKASRRAAIDRAILPNRGVGRLVSMTLRFSHRGEVDHRRRVLHTQPCPSHDFRCERRWRGDARSQRRRHEKSATFWTSPQH